MKITGFLAVILSAALLSACNNSASVNESGSVNETPAVNEKKADLYAKAALNAVGFPKMTKVEKADEIDAFFEFNTANYEDFSLYMNVMSVNLNRVLIVKPLPDKHDEVFAELKAYFDDLITNSAFYPAQESAAAGAKIGETADGYIYIIVHEDGETAVRAIENAVGG